MADTKGLTVTEMREKLDNARSRLKNIREKADSHAAELMDTAASSAAAFGMGFYKADAQRRGLSVQVAGMDPEVVLGLVGVIAGKQLGGDAGRLATAAGRALLNVAAYEAGKQRGAQAT